VGEEKSIALTDSLAEDRSVLVYAEQKLKYAAGNCKGRLLESDATADILSLLE
jgi:hypothetical protein